MTIHPFTPPKDSARTDERVAEQDSIRQQRRLRRLINDHRAARRLAALTRQRLQRAIAEQGRQHD